MAWLSSKLDARRPTDGGAANEGEVTKGDAAMGDVIAPSEDKSRANLGEADGVELAERKTDGTEGEDVVREGRVYKTYKRRWFGLVQLVLLNIVVSWDVCYPSITPTKQNRVADPASGSPSRPSPTPRRPTTASPRRPLTGSRRPSCSPSPSSPP